MIRKLALHGARPRESCIRKFERERYVIPSRLPYSEPQGSQMVRARYRVGQQKVEERNLPHPQCTDPFNGVRNTSSAFSKIVIALQDQKE